MKYASLASLASVVCVLWAPFLGVAQESTLSAEAAGVESSDVEGADELGAPAMPGDSVEERPWAEGVDEADQRQALVIFQRANDAYSANDYRVAVALYRDALSHWSHPAIHGNLSVALVYLDQPIDAFRHVEQALAFGTAPLGEVIHAQLLTNRRLLRAQLSTIEVRCDVEGAEVAMDGEGLVRSPFVESRIAVAGPHRIVASKPGFLTFTHEFDAPPGDSVQIDVNLVPLSQAATYERRYAEWAPWTLLGGGAALLLAGAIVQRSARNEINAYREDLTRLCPAGCSESELPSAVRNAETRGVRRNRSAITLISVGGVAAIVGGILLGLNSPRRVDVDADGTPITELRLSPMASHEHVGALLSGGF